MTFDSGDTTTGPGSAQPTTSAAHGAAIHDDATANASTTVESQPGARADAGSESSRLRRTMSIPSLLTSKNSPLLEKEGPRPTLFDLAHSQNEKRRWSEAVKKQHAHPQGAGHPISWRHLFKPPVVRQWITGRILVREEAEREAARFELFFDLVMVAVIHQLAEQAADMPSSWGIFIFVLTFHMVWSVWLDAKSFINTSGTDDVFQRLYILGVMALLLGFSSNASALSIECSNEPSDAESASGEAERLPLLTTTDNLTLVFVLPMVSTALELVSSYVVAIGQEGVRWARKHFRLLEDKDLEAAEHRKARHFAHSFTPAINIEHAVERLALFIVLVLGEMVMNTTFKAVANQSGVHTEYLRCFLSLCIAYAINWLYVDNDLSRTFLHALRRNWMTSITWHHLHYPLAASLIFASAATARMVTEVEPSLTYRHFFAGGQAITMITLGFLGLLHKPLDADHSALIPRPFRVVGRFAAGVIFACLPQAESLSSTSVLGIHAGTLFFLIITETIGKIGLVASPEKIERALAHPLEDGKEDMQVELDALGVQATEEMEHELLPHERGEDDVGIEEDLGHLRVTRIGREQRLAYSF
ncbi:hypothetical protein MNV49_004020 [Pseudohyphozyma bogoriensis]|nr:hypothetical protein MNV49_004020 [Pseudohyphozyma bogoriensis]